MVASRPLKPLILVRIQICPLRCLWHQTRVAQLAERNLDKDKDKDKDKVTSPNPVTSNWFTLKRTWSFRLVVRTASSLG